MICGYERLESMEKLGVIDEVRYNGLHHSPAT